MDEVDEPDVDQLADALMVLAERRSAMYDRALRALEDQAPRTAQVCATLALVDQTRLNAWVQLHPGVCMVSVNRAWRDHRPTRSVSL